MNRYLGPRGFIRVETRRTLRALQASAKHILREIPVPHAKRDPRYTNIVAGLKSTNEIVAAIFRARGRKPNSRESYGYEVLISTPGDIDHSPENKERFERSCEKLLHTALPTPPLTIA